MIRKATQADISAISSLYEEILCQEEQGLSSIGWIRGVYPTSATALEALERGDLFVKLEQNEVVAAAIINQIQVPSYSDIQWEYPASPQEVMVLHTLTVSPSHSRKGHGKAFVAFYEAYAQENGCHYLRMDTNVINSNARKLYRSLNYKEVGMVPCVFNGIPNVQLVCLEKKL